MTINDPHAKVVAGATVSVLKWTGNWKQVLQRRTTDSAGKVTLDSLPIDTNLAVHVSSAAHANTMHKLVFATPIVQEMTVIVAPPATGAIKIVDPDGKPIPGAMIQRLEITDRNEVLNYIRSADAGSLGFDLQPSDSQGRLTLPPLPDGARLKVVLLHPDWRPAQIEDLIVADQTLATVTMQPGVRLSVDLLDVNGQPQALDPQQAEIRMIEFQSEKRDGSVQHRFTIRDNQIQFTVCPLQYDRLIIQMDDYFVTPNLMHAAELPSPELDFTSGVEKTIRLNVRPKVRATGKVIDADGKPMAGVAMFSSIDALSAQWPAIDPAADLPQQTRWLTEMRRKWSSGGDAETDADGNYEIQLAAGSARVECIQMGYFCRPEFVEFEASATGTVVPTFKLHPVPVLRGVVNDSGGKPVAGAMVRMRSTGRGDAEPCGMTDDAGAFELKMTRIPYRLNAEGLVDNVSVVAMDVKRNLGGISTVDVTDSAATNQMVITVGPQPVDWIFQPQPDLPAIDPTWIASWTQQVEQGRSLYTAGMPGMTPPNLATGTWLNSPAKSLDDFRGQFVLLDFWFIGCGPCVRDQPTVKTAHQLFTDLGCTVIAVHRTGSTPDEVRDYANANGMTYPIVVDDANGTITDQYRKLGVVGFPSYILIGPDGTIVHNDATMMPPSLRRFKLERIYQAIRQAAVAE
ncbi:redoxin domain-containing protein [Stieleria sp. TO1_6]|nr:redoxin domain-containing protein [Stieleria tagensis]